MNDFSETLLVVGDEPSVLGLISMILQRRGYTVLVASSGKEALETLEDRNDVILVLADCDMPGISGPEMDEIILAQWPHIKVIAMSSRPRSPELRDTIEFIHKPFRSANLIAIVESALNREAAQSMRVSSASGPASAAPSVDALMLIKGDLL